MNWFRNQLSHHLAQIAQNQRYHFRGLSRSHNRDLG
jgi:hypothetical protein